MVSGNPAHQYQQNRSTWDAGEQTNANEAKGEEGNGGDPSQSQSKKGGVRSVRMWPGEYPQQEASPAD
jgi:hypothetical protein